MKKRKILSIEEFAELMLATLTKNPYNMGRIEVNLPANYKQRIQCILTTKNGWYTEFSPIINIKDYFEDHFKWENELADTIAELLSSQNKEIKYNLQQDSLVMNFTKEEVSQVLDKYDEEIKNIMTHFTNLLSSYIYSREYQEYFYDYFSEAVETMKEIKNRGEEKTVEDILTENASSRKNRFKFLEKLKNK